MFGSHFIFLALSFGLSGFCASGSGSDVKEMG